MAHNGDGEGDGGFGENSQDASESRTAATFSALSTSFLSDKYSDMTITCRGETFKAHRVVVCAQSPFFDRALNGNFAESASGVVDLPDDDPQIVKLFLQFLYTGTYDPRDEGPSNAALLATEAIERQLKQKPEVPNSLTSLLCADAMDIYDDDTASWNSYDSDSDTSEDSGSDESDDSGQAGSGNERAEADSDTSSSDDSDDSMSDSDNEDDDIPNNQQEDVPMNTDYNTLRIIYTDESFSIHQRVHMLTNLYLDQSQDFFIPLRLYIMADKFDVPALRLLARDRFHRAAQFLWEAIPDRFAEAVDEIYEKTLDAELRDTVCQLIGQSMVLSKQTVDGKYGAFKASMFPIMRKHGDLAVSVMEVVLNES